MDEAAAQGLSEKKERTENIWLKHKPVVRLKLGNDGPTDITLKKIQLDENKMLVKVSVRRYPDGQRRFLSVHLNSSLMLKYIRPDPAAPWQAAPH